MIKPEVRAKIEELVQTWPQNRVCAQLAYLLPGLKEEDIPSPRTISRIVAALKEAGIPHRRCTKTARMEIKKNQYKPPKPEMDLRIRAARAYLSGQHPADGEKRVTYASIAQDHNVNVHTLIWHVRKIQEVRRRPGRPSSHSESDKHLKRS